jgi:hypothetical protein
MTREHAHSPDPRISIAARLPAGDGIGLKYSTLLRPRLIGQPASGFTGSCVGNPRDRRDTRRLLPIS